jgi:hypothetical protein
MISSSNVAGNAFASQRAAPLTHVSGCKPGRPAVGRIDATCAIAPPRPIVGALAREANPICLLRHAPHRHSTVARRPRKHTLERPKARATRSKLAFQVDEPGSTEFPPRGARPRSARIYVVLFCRKDRFLATELRPRPAFILHQLRKLPRHARLTRSRRCEGPCPSALASGASSHAKLALNPSAAGRKPPVPCLRISRNALATVFRRSNRAPSARRRMRRRLHEHTARSEASSATPDPALRSGRPDAIVNCYATRARRQRHCRAFARRPFLRLAHSRSLPWHVCEYTLCGPRLRASIFGHLAAAVRYAVSQARKSIELRPLINLAPL